MKSIKDFLYNFNDIIVVILILAVAGGLIYWRVGEIMKYPEVMVKAMRADEGGGKESAPNVSGGSEEGDVPGPGGEGGSSGGESGEGGSSGGETSVSTPDPSGAPANSSIWQDGKLKAQMKVTIGGGSLTSAVNDLVTAGLYADLDDFYASCEAEGIDPDDIQAGTFSFEAGMTQEDIARVVTNN